MRHAARWTGPNQQWSFHPRTTLRVAVGSIWLAGAAYNLLVTTRISDPYGWIADGSAIAPWRWFFSEVVGPQPLMWTLLLVVGETVVGLLTLGRAGRGRLGLNGGAIFSLALFSLGTPYTMMMGPYALLLAWLGHQPADRHRPDMTQGRG